MIVLSQQRRLTMCKYVVIMPKNRIGILAKNAFEIKMK